MKILGISAWYHDAAACLVIDGRISAAAQEERFTRKRHDASFPHNAMAYCLAETGTQPAAIDHVVFYDKPFPKFERLLETWLAFAPRGYSSFAASFPLWVQDKLFQKRTIAAELRTLWGGSTDWEEKLLFSEHHLSHAASAFFPSPFTEAAVLTMDGVGEWATTSLALGSGNRLTLLKELRFPHSLGLLYSAFTHYTGFRVNSGEYKLMGLAPYGTPKYAGLIREHLLDLKDDGSFALDMQYFGYCTGLTMTTAKFDRLFGGPARIPEAELTQRHMDLAASVQAVAEEVIIRLAGELARITGSRNLSLAGGVALNCVANGRLLRERLFDHLWVQPAAGDAGGAVGAALAVWHLMLDKPRQAPAPGTDGMGGALLGPGFSDAETMAALTGRGAVFHPLDEAVVIEQTAQALAAGQVVGWMCGRMEFGPRALGARSILADPRSPAMQDTLNRKIKFRESFRPFAPSVPAEVADQWFDLHADSSYMQFVAPLTSPGIPAVTHVDRTARIQTVHAQTQPRYHRLLTRFGEITGCPVLINTSFNVRGEPIICTPDDALNCFMATGLDLLVIGNIVVHKHEQPPALAAQAAVVHDPD